MKEYFRIILGAKGVHADQCLKEGFIGADHGMALDLAASLPTDWENFKTKFSELYLKANPGKTRIAAGLAAGVLFRICRGMKPGDLVLASLGNGDYRICQVTGPYYYQPGTVLPHRRKVEWLGSTIPGTSLPEALKASAGATTAIIRLNEYSSQIEKLAGGIGAPSLISLDLDVEDATSFAMESHLEEFLVENWANTDFGDSYDIYDDENNTDKKKPLGKQYETEAGRIDILAVSKDRKELLVIELKKGRASDKVVGQIQRYMGFALTELAEPNQRVKGVIIAREDDANIRFALKVAKDIEFYTYQVNFKLNKVGG